ncbi:hypothetical protein LZ30DRAFT_694851 [Colletotrichum cereale]|nr:hypothetical protein LZ30DRAFT_694851 [Colletotrichum cereale]
MSATTTTTFTFSSVASEKGKDFETSVYYLSKTQEEVDREFVYDCPCNLFAEDLDDARLAYVHDFRPHVDEVNLEKNGYEIVPMIDRRWDLMNKDDDLQKIELQRYLTELCQLVKEHLGARFVTHFVSQVRPRCLRKADPNAITPLKKFTVPRPHCDFTDQSMPKFWELLNFDNELERWQSGIDMVVNDPNGITPRCQILGLCLEAFANHKTYAALPGQPQNSSSRRLGAGASCSEVGAERGLVAPQAQESRPIAARLALY